MVTKKYLSNGGKLSCQLWADEVRTKIVSHRKIGKDDWHFSKQQKELLQQYYDANLLLVACLNSDCFVIREVRQDIEDTLLLPIAEIEQRKERLV
jgi:hypothetical protein